MGAVFRAFPLQPGLLHSIREQPFPTEIYAWGSTRSSIPGGGTSFGYVVEGATEIQSQSCTFVLLAGMYFSIPGPLLLRGGQGLLIRSLHHHGYVHVGGPVEETGRLRYIDGCTDSLIIPPPILGDPCLNLLHLPSGTTQTQHTHPSFRIGIILSGEGECVTPSVRIPLRANLPFLIEPDGQHSFHTFDQSLRVLAYHPDSDFGPTHENHPMINRTIIPNVGE